MLPGPKVDVGSQSSRECRAVAETRLKRRDPTGGKLIFSHRVAQLAPEPIIPCKLMHEVQSHQPLTNAKYNTFAEEIFHFKISTVRLRRNRSRGSKHLFRVPEPLYALRHCFQETGSKGDN